MNIHVKICGITRVEDALLAEQLGASAVGFIFYPKSPRYISPEKARDISVSLGPFIARVGVFVNESPEMVNDIVDRAALTAVQIHSDENQDYMKKINNAALIKSFRIGEDFDPACIKPFSGMTLLLDTYVKEGYGGTGKTFDWTVAEKIARNERVILAGGLNKENIGSALDTACTWGVDVSSGIEDAPGMKNHEEMKALFESIRTAAD